MRWNVISCSAWRLYVIIDRSAIGARPPAEVAQAAIRGGADVLQLRDKTGSARWLLEEAKGLLPLTRRAGVPLIINDRVDIAMAVDADGVHLGQDDLPLKEARAILGPTRLIGKSTHTTAQALEAQVEGADYIGFGPIFPTPTKPEYSGIGLEAIGEVASRLHIPIVCIGGIECGNLEQVMGAGAPCIAMVRAVCAAEDPETATRDLKRVLVQYHRTHVAHHL